MTREESKERSKKKPRPQEASLDRASSFGGVGVLSHDDKVVGSVFVPTHTADVGHVRSRFPGQGLRRPLT